jgi:GrpB-like predicted nucleotidyltransferase (UPF0157 family)
MSREDRDPDNRAARRHVSPFSCDKSEGPSRGKPSKERHANGFVQRRSAVTTGDTRADRVARVTAEHVDVVPYDPDWPESFQREKRHLLGFLPRDIIGRIEHFGSTAVPGLSAKPIVDILVEVTDLEAVKARVVPILEAQGYEYFWRPTFGDDGEPFYAWFIKRNPETGQRTHHIHMVEGDFAEHWDRLLFRDYLREHPDVADEYGRLKCRLAYEFPDDRVAYTEGKSAFIGDVMRRARGSLKDGESDDADAK